MPRHSIPAALPTFAEYRSQPDFGCSVSHDRDAWLIAPVGTNRDADSVQRANWQTMTEELERIEREDDGAEMDAPGSEFEPQYEILRFGHFACGWVELCIVRPGTHCAAEAERMAERLESYPVLSDEALSQLESDEAAESWDNYGASDFKRALLKEFGNRRAAEFVCDVATDEQLREWMEELHPNEPYHFDSGGCSFPIDRAVSACGRGELARFAWKLRGLIRAA